MIVSGLPEKNGNQHVKEIAGVALDILESVLTFKIPHKPDRQLQLRIGNLLIVNNPYKPFTKLIMNTQDLKILLIPSSTKIHI